MSDPIPISLLNDYLYCHRRAALKIIEGWRADNAHTERGDIVHEHTDLAGYEVAKGVLLWRALPVWSERLGLSGKCDLVEAEFRSNAKSQIPNFESGGIATLKPVEFKLGKRRQWANDDVQVCAQALCLEEMFAIAIPQGAIYHADSKRRREVLFTAELRALTEKTVAEMHRLLGEFEGRRAGVGTAPLPPAILRPACTECSLHEICLPEVTDQKAKFLKVNQHLFEI